MYSFDWSVVPAILPVLLAGLVLTLEIAAATALIGLVAAVPVALARMSSLGFVRWTAQMYIELFRGTPLLVQLIWVYYALPVLLGIQLSPFVAVVLALAMNLTAFMAEAYRAGLQSVPVEHIEAGQVIGLSRLDVLRYITLPQAFWQQLPVVLSLIVSLIKDTSLVSAIGLAELTFNGNIESAHTFRPLEVYTTVALIYFCVAFPMTLLAGQLERRIRLRWSGGGESSGTGKVSLRTLLPRLLTGGVLPGR